MKSSIRALLLTLILMGLAWPASAVGQIIDGVTFSTRFPFTVGNTKFPAGSYTIRPMDNEPEIMEITGADGKTSALFETMTAELPTTPAKSEVVFKKYGDHYVLSEIYEMGSKIGAVAVRSHAERQHAKNSGKPSKEAVATTKTP